jgi:glutamate/aspartate transport system substrate-binding protein
MKNVIRIFVTTCLLGGASAPAKAQSLEGTLKKMKETGIITIGHRDSSIPLSYLDDKLQPVGFSLDLCKHVVEAAKAKLGMPDLKVAYNQDRGGSARQNRGRDGRHQYRAVRQQVE